MIRRESTADRSSRPGFTLIELLVVIGIIGVLIALLLPALNIAKRRSLYIKCGSNLHQIGLAMQNYAALNRGQLPQYTAGTSQYPGVWGGLYLWDLPYGTRNALVSSGAARGVFYCPVQSDTQNLDTLWDYSTHYMTAYPDPAVGFGVMGYWFLTYRPDPSSGFPNISPFSPTFDYWNNPTQDPKFAAPCRNWRYQKSMHADNRDCVDKPYKSNLPTDTELVTDVVADDGAGNFGDLKGGAAAPGQSAHWYGGYPVGGNILFLDGHVVNRPFKKTVIPGIGSDTTTPGIMHYRGSVPAANGNGGGYLRFYF